VFQKGDTHSVRATLIPDEPELSDSVPHNGILDYLSAVYGPADSFVFHEPLYFSGNIQVRTNYNRDIDPFLVVAGVWFIDRDSAYLISAERIGLVLNMHAGHGK
jgi:hypothetical protein